MRGLGDSYDERIRELYVERGLTLRQIATQVPLSYQSVRDRLVLMGVPRRGARGGMTPIKEYDEQIIYLYERGWTLHQISRKLPVSPMTVKRRLLENGVPLRPRGGAHIQVEWSEYERTKALYVDRDMSLLEVAAELGLSADAVRERLLRMGVPLRPKGGGSHKRTRRRARARELADPL